ncbi:uncharacterized protein LOC120346632 isoform X2 [Styela clava]
MKISIIFILIYVIASGWCQDETVFHCSSKPGCQFSHCDSDRVDIDAHTKEYPITCKSNSTVLSWLDLASMNSDITNIKVGLEILENKFDEKMESFGKEISRNHKSFNQIRDQSTKINNLLRRTTRQSNEVRELKKDLVEIKEMKEKLIKDNKKMKEENCKLKVGNTCHFFVLRHRRDVNYSKAVDICKKRNADVGLIRDEESYNAIVKYLRKNMPKGWVAITIWTGIQFDPLNGDVTPANSFIDWYPYQPVMGIDDKDRTNVHLVIDPNPNIRYQGMRNTFPRANWHGVICESLI